MTQAQILSWIKTNLGPHIQKALSENPGVIYTEDWLAGMAYRETGFLIARYMAKKMPPEMIHALMMGDYSQRNGEVKKYYHGFGYWQIDTGSYPQFINAGHWRDPFLTCMKAIAVLEEKRKWLAGKFKINDSDLADRAITAAYNCGQGNVYKALKAGKDVDLYTHNHDYSRMVWQYRETYRKLINGNNV